MIGATLESWHSRAMQVVVEGVGEHRAYCRNEYFAKKHCDYISPGKAGGTDRVTFRCVECATS